MTLSRPRIGITTSYADGAQSLDIRYIEAVEAAGGIALIVPLLRSEAAANDFAALLDGLIITGGPGIIRGLIGDLPPDLPPVDPLRDRGDELIVRAMGAKPQLGICYGMQFVNALCGGTIYGDVQARIKADIHSADRGGGEHEIHIVPGSHLHAIVGGDRLITNSHHIQAIVMPGAGLRVTARADDAVVEALESDDGRFIGVQFHPERMQGAARQLFADLIRRARSR